MMYFTSVGMQFSYENENINSSKSFLFMIGQGKLILSCFLIVLKAQLFELLPIISNSIPTVRDFFRSDSISSSACFLRVMVWNTQQDFFI